MDTDFYVVTLGVITGAMLPAVLQDPVFRVCRAAKVLPNSLNRKEARLCDLVLVNWSSVFSSNSVMDVDTYRRALPYTVGDVFDDYVNRGVQQAREQIRRYGEERSLNCSIHGRPQPHNQDTIVGDMFMRQGVLRKTINELYQNAIFKAHLCNKSFRRESYEFVR